MRGASQKAIDTMIGTLFACAALAFLPLIVAWSRRYRIMTLFGVLLAIKAGVSLIVTADLSSTAPKHNAASSDSSAEQRSPILQGYSSDGISFQHDQYWRVQKDSRPGVLKITIKDPECIIAVVKSTSINAVELRDALMEGMSEALREAGVNPSSNPCARQVAGRDRSGTTRRLALMGTAYVQECYAFQQGRSAFALLLGWPVTKEGGERRIQNLLDSLSLE